MVNSVSDDGDDHQHVIETTTTSSSSSSRTHHPSPPSSRRRVLNKGATTTGQKMFDVKEKLAEVRRLQRVSINKLTLCFENQKREPMKHLDESFWNDNAALSRKILRILFSFAVPLAIISSGYDYQKYYEGDPHIAHSLIGIKLGIVVFCLLPAIKFLRNRKVFLRRLNTMPFFVACISFFFIFWSYLAEDVRYGKHLLWLVLCFSYMPIRTPVMFSMLLAYCALFFALLRVKHSQNCSASEAPWEELSSIHANFLQTANLSYFTDFDCTTASDRGGNPLSALFSGTSRNNCYDSVGRSITWRDYCEECQSAAVSCADRLKYPYFQLQHGLPPFDNSTAGSPYKCQNADENVITTANLILSTLTMATMAFFLAWYNKGHELTLRSNHLQVQISKAQRAVLVQQEVMNDALLSSMLPQQIVDELKTNTTDGGMDCAASIVSSYDEVTVLFCIIDDFPRITSALKPGDLVLLLNAVYSAFDQLTDTHKVHKVETVGEVYMAVCGCPDKRRRLDHARHAADMSLAMLDAIEDLQPSLAALGITNLKIKIGLNTGAITAGVIGNASPRFKLFGDTVNTSSRMESTSLPGRIQMTGATHAHLVGQGYAMEARDPIRVKGKGLMQTYFLVGMGSATTPSTPNNAALSVVEEVSCSPARARDVNQIKKKDVEAPAKVGGGDLAAGHHGATVLPAPDLSRCRGHRSTFVSFGIPPKPSRVGTFSPGSFAMDLFGNTEDDEDAPPLKMSSSTRRLKTTAAEREQARQARGGSSTKWQSPPVVAEKKKKSNNQESDNKDSSGSGKSTTSIKPQSMMLLGMDTRSQNFNEQIQLAVSDKSARIVAIREGQQEELFNRLTDKPEPHLPLYQSLWLFLGTDLLTVCEEDAFDAASAEASYRVSSFDDNVTMLQRFLAVVFVLQLSTGLFEILGGANGELDVNQGGRLSFCSTHVSNWYGSLSGHQAFTLHLVVRFGLQFLVIIVMFISSKRHLFFYRHHQSIVGWGLLVLGLCFTLLNTILTDTPGYAVCAIFVSIQYLVHLVPFVYRLMMVFVVAVLYLIMADNFALDKYKLATEDTTYHFAMLLLFGALLGPAMFIQEYVSRVSFNRTWIIQEQQMKIAEEQKRSRKLLNSLLPPSVVKGLQAGRQVAEVFAEATVIFTDMVGFTAFSSTVTAEELVAFLNKLFSRFDQVLQSHGVYKVEIIGDALFAVAGCPERDGKNPSYARTHTERAIAAVIDIMEVVRSMRENEGVAVRIRAGLHTGPVVAAVVGMKDPRYHLFGDTVGYAEKMESSGVPDRIQVSRSFYKTYNSARKKLAEAGGKETQHEFTFEERPVAGATAEDDSKRTYLLSSHHHDKSRAMQSCMHDAEDTSDLLHDFIQTAAADTRDETQSAVDRLLLPPDEPVGEGREGSDARKMPRDGNKNPRKSLIQRKTLGMDRKISSEDEP